MDHKTHQQLEQELSEGAAKVQIDGIYTHYKNPEQKYRVVGLGIQEASDEICVLYQPLQNNKITFVRDLKNWLEQPQPGQDRFSLVTD